jgi:small conductance mechanosensitive channel
MAPTARSGSSRTRSYGTSRSPTTTATPLRRVDVRVVIPKGRDVEKARRIALEIAQPDHCVLASPAPDAGVTEIAETNTVVVVRAWATSANYFLALRDMLTEIQRRLDTTDLSLPKPATGEPPKPS